MASTIPTDVNDRMLLGLKCTMSEVELHVMAQRLQAAKRPPPSAASCAPRCRSATSTTRRARSSSTPTPRSRPRSRDLFAAFAACGSAYGVVAAFAGRRFPLRAYGGAWAGQLRWGALTHARVLGVLKNPVLRRGVRARPLHHHGAASIPTARCAPACRAAPRPSGRC